MIKTAILGSNFIKKYGKLPVLLYKLEVLRAKNAAMFSLGLVRNRKRMSYDRIADMGLPIGSGAMESAIRRVVNLRLKGASIFWHRNAAEAMLLLPCFFKAGR